MIVFGALLTSGQAATKAGYQPAKVVSVESRAIPSNNIGDNPSDAPLQPQTYSYDIGILLGGSVYQARYDSAVDELPSAIAPNHAIQVNLKKHTMDVNSRRRHAADVDRKSHQRQKRVPSTRQRGRCPTLNGGRPLLASFARSGRLQDNSCKRNIYPVSPFGERDSVPIFPRQPPEVQMLASANPRSSQSVGPDLR